MAGIVELAEEIFHMPVRIGVPKYVGGLAEVVKTPRFSTGVGLLLYGKDQIQMHIGPKGGVNSLSQLFFRMKAWLAGNF